MCYSLVFAAPMSKRALFTPEAWRSRRYCLGGMPVPTKSPPPPMMPDVLNGRPPLHSCKYTVLMFGFEPVQKDAAASSTPLTFDLYVAGARDRAGRAETGRAGRDF